MPTFLFCIMKSEDQRRNQTTRIPGQGFRARIRACGLFLVISGMLLIPAVAYASYGAQLVTDLLILYLFLLLPVGFLLLGYSVARRWLRLTLALGFLVTEWITLTALNAFTSTSEPGSFIQWYGAVYGPPVVAVVAVGFVVAVTYGLIFVPQRAKPGHCRKCGYSLRGLTEARCPECGTPFDSQEERAQDDSWL